MAVNIRNFKENDDKTHYNSGISTIDKILNHLENKKYQDIVSKQIIEDYLSNRKNI